MRPTRTAWRRLLPACFVLMQGVVGCVSQPAPLARETSPAASPTPMPTPVIPAPATLTRQLVQFETLAQGESFTAGFRQPTVLIARNASQAEQLAARVQEPEVAEKIKAVAFGKDLLLAVFLEAKSSSGHKITVREITVDQAEVRVIVELGEPAPGQAVLDVLAFPYHVVLVPSGSALLPQRFAVKVFTSAGQLIAQAESS